MSETQNNVVPSQEHDKQQEKKGLKLAGYVIPWWVVVVVVIVLVYLAYDNNMFDFMCNPNKKISLVSQSSAPLAKGTPLPQMMTFGQELPNDIPKNLKNLFA